MKKLKRHSNTAEGNSSCPHAIYVVPVTVHFLDCQSGFETNVHILFGIHGGTGLVAGFHFANEGPDPSRLIHCMANCLLPKDSLLKEQELPGYWPVSGCFDVFDVPEAVVGDMEFLLRKLCHNHGIRLEVRADDDPVPEIVQSTAVVCSQRTEEAFCLDDHEIEQMPQFFPNIWRRAALHSFTYRPTRGFVEHICSPPEWQQYVDTHPIQPMSEYRQEATRQDFGTAATICFSLMHPSPALRAGHSNPRERHKLNDQKWAPAEVGNLSSDGRSPASSMNHFSC